MDVQIKHNLDDFAKELEGLSSKQFKSIFNRSLTRSLNKGKAVSIRLLKTKHRKPKDETWPEYFESKSKKQGYKPKSRVPRIRTRVEKSGTQEHDGAIYYGIRQRNAAAYTTENKLSVHRERSAKQFGWIASASAKRPGARKRKPLKPKARRLKLKLQVGKTTVIKTAFASKPYGSWVVLKRTGDNRKQLSAVRGPSVAQTMRSNRFFQLRVRAAMNESFNREFSNALDTRLKSLEKRLANAKLKQRKKLLGF